MTYEQALKDAFHWMALAEADILSQKSVQIYVPRATMYFAAATAIKLGETHGS